MSAKPKWPEDYTPCFDQRDLDKCIADTRKRTIEEAAKVADAEAAQQLENWKAATDPEHIKAYKHGTAVLTSLAAAIRSLSTGGE